MQSKAKVSNYIKFSFVKCLKTENIKKECVLLNIYNVRNAFNVSSTNKTNIQQKDREKMK